MVKNLFEEYKNFLESMAIDADRREEQSMPWTDDDLYKEAEGNLQIIINGMNDELQSADPDDFEYYAEVIYDKLHEEMGSHADKFNDLFGIDFKQKIKDILKSKYFQLDEFNNVQSMGVGNPASPFTHTLGEDVDPATRFFMEMSTYNPLEEAKNALKAGRKLAEVAEEFDIHPDVLEAFDADEHNASNTKLMQKNHDTYEHGKEDSKESVIDGKNPTNETTCAGNVATVNGGFDPNGEWRSIYEDDLEEGNTVMTEGTMDDAVSDLNVEGLDALEEIAAEYGVDPVDLKQAYDAYLERRANVAKANHRDDLHAEAARRLAAEEKARAKEKATRLKRGMSPEDAEFADMYDQTIRKLANYMADAAGNAFPDGDPMDMIMQKAKKLIHPYYVEKLLDFAKKQFKKEYGQDYGEYIASLWDDQYGQAKHDGNEEMLHSLGDKNPWR